jgi:hypothetical protein
MVKIILAATLITATPALAQYVEDEGTYTWFPHSASECVFPPNGDVWFPSAWCPDDPPDPPKAQRHERQRYPLRQQPLLPRRGQ